MTPSQRFEAARRGGSLELKKLYTRLGSELNSAVNKADITWRRDAMAVRRRIESEIGPQERGTWTGRTHVTIAKPSPTWSRPKPGTEGTQEPKPAPGDRNISIVVHDPETGEVVMTKLLSDLNLSSSDLAAILRRVLG